MASELYSTSENLEKVIRDFSSKLQTYIDNMRTELDALKKAMSVLGSGWTDSNSDAFAVTMREKMNEISKILERSEELKNYLDERALEYRELMELLSAVNDD